MKLFRCFAVLFFLTVTQALGFRFVVYGDCREPRSAWPSSFNQTVMSFINAKITALNPRPAFVLFLGDMVNRASYGSQPYTYNYLTDWKAFMEQTLDGIPFYTAVGNSDLYGESWWTEYDLQTAYQSIFSNMPDNGPTNYKKLVYSFEYGSGSERSLFVVLDSFGFYADHTTNYDNGYGTEQIDWFRAQAQASNAPHKFVLTHGPAFSVEGWPVHNAPEIWQIAKANNFDMFYCAHEHIYSRWEIATTSPQLSLQQRFIQTLSGCAGASIDPVSRIKANAQKAHVHCVMSYVVVDVRGTNVVQHAYQVVANDAQALETYDLDKVLLIK